MAKRKKDKPSLSSKSSQQQDRQEGLVSGAIQVVGSVAGAAAAVTDFLATQIAGEPILVKEGKAKRSGQPNRATSKKAGAKKGTAREEGRGTTRKATAKKGSQAASGAKKRTRGKIEEKKTGGERGDGKVGKSRKASKK